MIQPKAFLTFLKNKGITFFTGVPDSLLKPFCSCVQTEMEPGQHIITANEGNAIGLAIGHYLGKKKPAVVYMQNSGFGNTVNPLTSMADPMVFGIPMILLIGWRGEPGVKDEPQHVKQGIIMESLLDLLDIPFVTLTMGWDQDQSALEELMALTVKEQRPVAILVKKNTFESYPDPTPPSSKEYVSRESMIEALLDAVPDESCIVSTTGKTSRELYELRQKEATPKTDFLTIGAMGHCSQIALGLALAKPEKLILALDGDGSLLMHMGSLPVTAQQTAPNFHHILLDNGCHESVGEQPTVSEFIDYEKVVDGVGYRSYRKIESVEELKTIDWAQEGPCLTHIKIAAGSRKDLGRPTQTPAQIKDAFIAQIDQ